MHPVLFGEEAIQYLFIFILLFLFSLSTLFYGFQSHSHYHVSQFMLFQITPINVLFYYILSFKFKTINTHVSD